MAYAHAAHLEQLLQYEEEEMTTYNKEDLAGWEFKILRSATSQFKDPEKLNQAVMEEAAFGWELVEKFDNSRLRFKRPTKARTLPAPSGSDPYRTEFGMSEGRLAVWIILSIVAGFVAIGILVSLFVK